VSTAGGSTWETAGAFIPVGCASPGTPIGVAGEVGVARPFNAVWWSFTAPVDGRLVFDLFGSTGTGSPDTSVVVYEGGTDEGTAASVGDIEDDNPADDPPPGTEFLSSGVVEVTAGQTYHFKVGTWYDHFFLPDEYVLTGTLYVVDDPTWLDQDPLSGSTTAAETDFDGAALTVTINDYLALVFRPTFATWFGANDDAGTITVQEGWDTFRGASNIGVRSNPTLGGLPYPFNAHAAIYGHADLDYDYSDPGAHDGHYFIWNGSVMVTDVTVHTKNTEFPPGTVVEYESENASVDLEVSISWTPGPDVDYDVTSPFNPPAPSVQRDAGMLRLLDMSDESAELVGPAFPAGLVGLHPSTTVIARSGDTQPVGDGMDFCATVVPVPEKLWDSTAEYLDKFDALWQALEIAYSAVTTVTRSRYRLLVPYSFGIPIRRTYPRPYHRVYPPPPTVQWGRRGGSASIL
jgi:hypothetical protein